MAYFSGCNYHKLTGGAFPDVNLSICVSEDSSNVNCSLTISPPVAGVDFRYDWKMELQRLGYNEGWNTIGTRTGYVSNTSPSNRTFTNVGRTGDAMQVKVSFYDVSTGRLIGIRNSQTWFR